MYCSIHISSSCAFRIFVDRDPDQEQENVYRFALNRVVPVYLYFEGFRKGYLIRTCPGSCRLPNVDRRVAELVSVSGYRAGYLKQFTNVLRKYKINLDDMPDRFFIMLSLAITGPRFSKQKALKLFSMFREFRKGELII